MVAFGRVSVSLNTDATKNQFFFVCLFRKCISVAGFFVEIYPPFKYRRDLSFHFVLVYIHVRSLLWPLMVDGLIDTV